MRTKSVLLTCCMLLLAANFTTALAGEIDASLENIMAYKSESDTVSVLVFLQDRVNIEALHAEFTDARAPLAVRHHTVVTALQEKARTTQPALLRTLDELRDAGQIDYFEPFWITNTVRVDGPVSIIRQLATRADVKRIYFNYPVELIAPIAERKAEASPADEPEIGLEAIRVPEAWALGFTGEGTLVSTLDTGVDGNHPALASRWAGTKPEYSGHPEWAWRDVLGGYEGFPADSGTHGTHTMGTVCGGAPGDQIGVAPGAYWISDNSIGQSVTPEFFSDVIGTYEWLIDPDGNPNTHWDVPDTNSNSWGVNEWWDIPPCDEFFWDALDACEAAGIVILFSAGNEGTSGLRRPADRATTPYNVCAVAAVDANDPSWPIAGFSSRGPTYCTPDGSAAIKPDISAPGVDVRSAAPGGDYSYKSGTSMASPHTNGVVALMRQACPDLPPDVAKQIMYETAVDLGSSGEDNTYGWGMVDAYECVTMAAAWCVSPPTVEDVYVETAVNNAATIELPGVDYDGGPEPVAWKITSLPQQPLMDAGNDYVITENDLPYTLMNNGNLVTYAPANDFYGYDPFTFVATDGGQPPEGGDSETATVTVLVKYDPPTIITEELPDGCLNIPYGPVAIEVNQGQPDLQFSFLEDVYTEAGLGDALFSYAGDPEGWNADDQVWTYNLPFSFPFFLEEYSSCYVCSNGYIDFAYEYPEYFNNDQGLIDNIRIAPLWDNLRTDFGGNIYIDESVAGEVTIRWRGSHVSTGMNVNFSVTLFNNGEMRFEYGGGNTNLTPTIGISGGPGSNYLLLSYNGQSNLQWADSVDIVQPSPLPAGVELSLDGVISGTPTTAGAYVARFRVQDALGRADTQELSLFVSEECSFEPGDMNCDGAVDFDDISAFVIALGGQTAYEAAYPNCDWLNGDINGDNTVDFDDIADFVALIGG